MGIRDILTIYCGIAKFHSSPCVFVCQSM